jgi:RNA polymerase sigma-70 factor (ECF subfamily)
LFNFTKEKLNKMSITEFSALVVNHAEDLKPYAITLTRDTNTAQDLCQETVYKALSHHHQYRPGTNIKAWLCTIMRNIFINDYRREERKKSVMDVVQYNERQATPVSAEGSMRLKEIHAALYNLPGIFKTACLLYLQGYQYNEIAVALNEPLGTIKSRIHFARKMLKSKIDR